MAEAKTIAFHTLGCKLNFSETASLSRLMEKEGFEKRAFDALADIYVINTCSVTENADRECRYLVRQIQRKSPESFVVITGCYAQLKPKEIAEIPGVDLVLGASEKFNLATHLKELVKGDAAKICSCDIGEVKDFHDGFSVSDRTRAFLKVQDGCDYQCSFCTIPLARGKSRSDLPGHVLQNVKELAARGIKEVVLTGVNLGDFRNMEPGSGKKETGFFELAHSLDQMKEMPRFRISSIEPNLLTNEIIDLVANSDRFMPHFHIPLQSGSNRILAMMRRRYRRESMPLRSWRPLRRTEFWAFCTPGSARPAPPISCRVQSSTACGPRPAGRPRWSWRSASSCSASSRRSTAAGSTCF